MYAIVHAILDLSGTPMKSDPDAPIIDAEIYQRLVKEVRDYAIFMLDRKGFVRTGMPGPNA